jgi:hypothetical protein
MERAGADGGMFDGGLMGMDLTPMEHEDRVGGASGSRSKRYRPPPASFPTIPTLRPPELFEYACKAERAGDHWAIPVTLSTPPTHS